MQKRAIILCAALLCTLSGCGKKEETTEKSSANIVEKEVLKGGDTAVVMTAEVTTEVTTTVKTGVPTEATTEITTTEAVTTEAETTEMPASRSVQSETEEQKHSSLAPPDPELINTESFDEGYNDANFKAGLIEFMHERVWGKEHRIPEDVWCTKAEFLGHSDRMKKDYLAVLTFSNGEVYHVEIAVHEAVWYIFEDAFADGDPSGGP